MNTPNWYSKGDEAYVKLCDIVAESDKYAQYMDDACGEVELAVWLAHLDRALGLISYRDLPDADYYDLSWQMSPSECAAELLAECGANF